MLFGNMILRRWIVKELLLKSRNFSVVREHFDPETAGVEKTIEYVEQPCVVIAVPVLDDGQIILVEHLRPILGTTLLECPGGKVDSGEDLESSITRELQEEIGYTPGELEYISYLYSSVGSSTEKIHLFVAPKLSPHVRKPEDAKRMQIKQRTAENVLRLLQSNRIHDGKTEIALYKYFSRCVATIGELGIATNVEIDGDF